MCYIVGFIYFFLFFLSAGDLNKYVELLFNTDDLRWPLTSQHRLLTSFPASGEGDVRLTNIIISRRLIKNNHETNSGNSSHCRVSCRGSGRFSTADSSADAAFKDSGEIGSFMTMLPVNVKEKKTPKQPRSKLFCNFYSLCENCYLRILKLFFEKERQCEWRSKGSVRQLDAKCFLEDVWPLIKEPSSVLTDGGE